MHNLTIIEEIVMILIILGMHYNKIKNMAYQNHQLIIFK